ncbi:hypothetical protein BU16DRAFT_529973 [Lophium mytilinum]|uniref:Apple domain-containing protein n=1 Tax=Lophium mytilinum TaxID=390894 RepID=A0A6A6QGC3_9PEZI|nr:hypothetical protein BU16DRAFT_529973 [Lophium mytilinum]
METTTPNPHDSIVFSEASHSNPRESSLLPKSTPDPTTSSRILTQPQDFDSEPQWLPPGFDKESQKNKVQIRPAYLLLIAVAVVLAMALVGGLAGGLTARRHKSESKEEMIAVQSVGVSSTVELIHNTPLPSQSKPSATSRSLTTSASLTTSTSTPTPTYVTSGTTGMAELPCPYDTSVPYLESTTRTSFNVSCGTDMPEWMTGANGFHVHDDSRFVAYTLEDCLEKCAVTPKCAAAAYGANLTELVEVRGGTGNCFLKNSTVTQPVGSFGWMITAMRNP